MASKSWPVGQEKVLNGLTLEMSWIFCEDGVGGGSHGLSVCWGRLSLYFLKLEIYLSKQAHVPRWAAIRTSF